MAAGSIDEQLHAYLADREQHYNPQLAMVGQSVHSPGYHTRMLDGTWAHSTREAAIYAVSLLQSGKPEHVERAQHVLEKLLSLQETDPTRSTYGIWSWFLEEPLDQMQPPDWNWADFIGAELAMVLRHHAATLPPDLLDQVRAALSHAAWAIFRRNVGPGYTNIAFMGAAVTLAAGELLDEPRLLAYGRRRLQRIDQFRREIGGFQEYNSPTYTLVALEQCERILDIVRDPRARDLAETLRLAIWRMIADHFHPGSQQWAGPHARTYSDRLRPGQTQTLSKRLGFAIHTHSAQDECPRLRETMPPLPCPAQLVDRFKRLDKTPTVVIQQCGRRRDNGQARIATTWLSEHACLGTVNEDSLWTQRRPLIAYWSLGNGQSAVLRLRFLHDGQDFASAVVRNSQHGPRALSSVALLSNQGDFHCHLDRPPDGVFRGSDFRLRYELNAPHAGAKVLDAGRYELAVGDCRAVLHALPGRFADSPIRWELGQNGQSAFLDAVCHHGPAMDLNPETCGQVLLVAGVEINEPNQPASATAPSVDERDGQVVATWECTMKLVAPTDAVPLG